MRRSAAVAGKKVANPKRASPALGAVVHELIGDVVKMVSVERFERFTDRPPEATPPSEISRPMTAVTAATRTLRLPSRSGSMSQRHALGSAVQAGREPLAPTLARCAKSRRTSHTFFTMRPTGTSRALGKTSGMRSDCISRTQTRSRERK